MAATAALVTTIASTAVAVGSQLYQGQMQAQQASYQADLSRKQGELAELNARQEAADIQFASQHKRATQIAEGAAAGVEVNSGSLLDVIASSAKTAEEERQNVLRAGRLNRAAYEAQAGGYSMGGSAARTGSLWGAGASLMWGASNGVNIASKAGWFDSYKGDGTRK